MGKNPIYAGGGLKRSLGCPERYPKEKQAYDGRILGDGEFVLDLIGQGEIVDEHDGVRDIRKLIASSLPITIG